jgi:sirohydrochlorin ferrochelatase
MAIGFQTVWQHKLPAEHKGKLPNGNATFRRKVAHLKRKVVHPKRKVAHLKRKIESCLKEGLKNVLGFGNF